MFIRRNHHGARPCVWNGYRRKGCVCHAREHGADVPLLLAGVRDQVRCKPACLHAPRRKAVGLIADDGRQSQAGRSAPRRVAPRRIGLGSIGARHRARAKGRDRRACVRHSAPLRTPDKSTSSHIHSHITYGEPPLQATRISFAFARGHKVFSDNPGSHRFSRVFRPTPRQPDTENQGSLDPQSS